MTEKKKAKRDFAMHINQVTIIGRLSKPAKAKDDRVIANIVVPSWTKDGRQWVPFTIDVIGEDRGRVAEAAVGDYLSCTARLVKRSVKDDNGDQKTMLWLQSDPFRDLVVSPGVTGEGYDPFNPPDDALCRADVLLAGRCFIRKSQIDKGDGDTPILREHNDRKYCYVTMTYEDPFQELPDEGYPDALYIDFSLNGKTAEIASKFCRRRAQVVVTGRLSKKAVDFTITRGDKTVSPEEPRVMTAPGGFHFVNLDRSSGGDGGGAKKEPEAAKGYDDDDTDGLYDDDLPF